MIIIIAIFNNYKVKESDWGNARTEVDHLALI